MESFGICLSEIWRSSAMKRVDVRDDSRSC
jgi:hypothetical protein